MIASLLIPFLGNRGFLGYGVHLSQHFREPRTAAAYSPVSLSKVAKYSAHARWKIVADSYRKASYLASQVSDMLFVSNSYILANHFFANDT